MNLKDTQTLAFTLSPGYADLITQSHYRHLHLLLHSLAWELPNGTECFGECA